MYIYVSLAVTGSYAYYQPPGTVPGYTVPAVQQMHQLSAQMNHQVVARGVTANLTTVTVRQWHG